MRFFIFFCIFLLCAQNTQAQSPIAQRIWEIAQSGSWKFTDNKFHIGIMGNSALAKELTELAKGKTIAGKEVAVERLFTMGGFRGNHLAFIDGESTKNNFIGEIVEKMTKDGFTGLAITAKAGMLEEGSHINLLNGGTVCEINVPEVQKAGVALNYGGIKGAIPKTVKVKDYETNNVNIKEKIKEITGSGKEKTEDKQNEGTSRFKAGGGEAEGMEKETTKLTESERLLGRAASEKALQDKQGENLKAYIRELERMLDANKIDYQSLKSQYDTDQAKAEREIKSLNLTLIAHDSLHKKNELIASQQLALVQAREQTAKADARTNFYIAMAGIGLALLSIGSAYLAYRDRQIIASEKQKSEALLLNILPASVAQELKEKGVATPQEYELASVLFTDFKGFTDIAGDMSPDALIQELDKCFLAFDEIVEKHGLERIKTIGDSYMCAGGVPKTNKTNPIDAVKAGIEMQAFMQQLKTQRIAEGKPYFECRLGINSGKIVAGVVGKKKFAYDIWGDAVNVASRMESSGEINRVNISEATYQLVKDQFKCEHRGKINAKGKGDIDMYFVNGAV